MVQRIHQFQPPFLTPSTKPNKPQKTVAFKDVLTEQQGIKVSKHAKQRLQERNIHINEQQWKKIEQKVNEARMKGVKDSLVIMNDSTLLVSAKNNTVITAMNKQEATSKIFTNIDGTILLDE